MKRNIGFLMLVSVLFLVSCVPTQQFQRLKEKEKECADKVEELTHKNLELSENNNEIKEDFDALNKKYQNLLADTVSQAHRFQLMQERLNRMQQSNNDLMAQFSKNQKGNNREVKALLKQVQKAQNDLQQRENELLKVEQEMNVRRKKLEQLQQQLSNRNQRMQELQNALIQKEKVVKALKSKVMKALTGFDGNGLTISTKNGKVYVSMEDKLLFKSGSYSIDSRGADALGKLAKVLVRNPDINVMIEGHTDNVPYKGSGVLKDNWDLSAKRATTVVRLLAKNKHIAPQRLTIAGRSKYLPIADNSTAVGRSKNRRTEIILTPKLDEVFKLLENN